MARVEQLKVRVKELEQQLQESAREVSTRPGQTPPCSPAARSGDTHPPPTCPPQAEMERALLQGEREAERTLLQKEQKAAEQLQERLGSLETGIQKERDKVTPFRPREPHTTSFVLHTGGPIGLCGQCQLGEHCQDCAGSGLYLGLSLLSLSAWSLQSGFGGSGESGHGLRWGVSTAGRIGVAQHSHAAMQRGGLGPSGRAFSTPACLGGSEQVSASHQPSGSAASVPWWSQDLALPLSDSVPSCRGCASHAQDAQHRSKSSDMEGPSLSGFDSIFPNDSLAILFLSVFLPLLSFEALPRYSPTFQPSPPFSFCFLSLGSGP